MSKIEQDSDICLPGSPAITDRFRFIRDSLANAVVCYDVRLDNHIVDYAIHDKLEEYIWKSSKRALGEIAAEVHGDLYEKRRYHDFTRYEYRMGAISSVKLLALQEALNEIYEYLLKVEASSLPDDGLSSASSLARTAAAAVRTKTEPPS